MVCVAHCLLLLALPSLSLSSSLSIPGFGGFDQKTSSRKKIPDVMGSFREDLPGHSLEYKDPHFQDWTSTMPQEHHRQRLVCYDPQVDMHIPEWVDDPTMSAKVQQYLRGSDEDDGERELAVEDVHRVDRPFNPHRIDKMEEARQKGYYEEEKRRYDQLTAKHKANPKKYHY